MRFHFLILMLTLLSFSTNASAQIFGDNDLFLGYDDLSNPSEILIAAADGFTVNSVPYFTAFFGAPDPFNPSDFATDNPGFRDNAGAVNEGDRIFANVLNASTTPLAGGVGYVNFYNPSTDQLEATGRLEFESGSAATPSLIINGSTVESGDIQRLVATAGPDIHSHVFIDLLDDATTPSGAYGVLLELQSDFGPSHDGVIDATSEPIWFIWNHQMSNTEFLNSALPAFVNATAAIELGDFDQDGDVGLADLDRYIGNLDMDATGNLEALDLNSNGIVDSDDFQQFYEQLVETSNGGTGTFAGDINLDGTVNILGDAFLLVASLGNTVTSWGDGDLNGDGTVSVLGDAFLLVANLGNSNTN